MALTQSLFDEILTALVKTRITYIKNKMQRFHEDITFEEAPNYWHDIENYFELLKTAFETDNPQKLPLVFNSVLRMNLTMSEIQFFDSWITTRCIALQLIPFDIHAVANELNDSFGTNFAFSLVPIPPDQALKITYVLKDTSSVVKNGLFAVLTKPGHQEHCILDVVHKKTAPMY